MGRGALTTVGITEDVIREIVRRILSVCRPRQIILFGSAAAGGMTRDSDIDLLVVEDAPSDARQEAVRVRSAVGDVGHPVDVLVIASERFEETKNVIGGIAYPAHKYGKVIYEAA